MFCFYLYVKNPAILFIKNTVKSYEKISNQPMPSKNIMIYYDLLRKVYKEADKKSLVYIPYSERDYWSGTLNKFNMNFFSQAISERPSLYGGVGGTYYLLENYQEIFKKNKKDYTEKELLEEAKKLGFKFIYCIKDKKLKKIDIN